MMLLGDKKVAIVHDELVRKGGAEAVVEELLRMFPHADLYALYSSNTPFITIDGKRYRIRTTFLQRTPMWFRRHPKRLAPLLLHAAERLDLSDYDVVISSSSAFAKGVITRSRVPHICYCHTPTRYVWERKPNGIVESIGQHFLRMMDFAAAQRPSMYIANSEYTQQRIKTYYRRESEVIYPPVETDFFSPNTSTKDDYMVCVGRLTPAKHFDHAISVCEKLRIPLRIIGTGHHEQTLKQRVGTYTTFLGKISKEELRKQLQGARALLQPGVEDFGIASVEALACGTPVIAVGKGGAREIVRPHKDGILYKEETPELLADAIRQFIEQESQFTASDMQHHAFRFSTTTFRNSLNRTIEEVMRTQQT